jgi:acetyl esterase/lipase
MLELRSLAWAATAAAAAVVIFFLAIAMAPSRIVNAIAVFGNYSVQSSVRYGEGARRTLDVYRPPPSRQAQPVAIFFYGGSWNSGSKDDYRFVGAALAERGAIVIIPDYRLYPEVRFPAFLEDAALAVRWSKDNARRLGGDPDRVFLIGHSAGAYLAAMLALDPRWLASVGMVSECDIGAWVGLAGPYDLESHGDDPRRDIFNQIKDQESARPASFASPSAPPAFLATGGVDTAVAPRNSLDLARRIQEVGGRVETSIYPGLGHRALIGAFSPIFQFRFHVLDDVTNFLRESSFRRPCGSTHWSSSSL